MFSEYEIIKCRIFSCMQTTFKDLNQIILGKKFLTHQLKIVIKHYIDQRVTSVIATALEFDLIPIYQLNAQSSSFELENIWSPKQLTEISPLSDSIYKAYFEEDIPADPD